MKGAEQTIEKAFESLSSIDRISDLSGGSCLASPMMPNTVLIGEDGLPNMDPNGNIFMYNSDDQRYSNTISSTSSTRSNGHSGKFMANALSSVTGGKSKSRSKSSSKSSPSQRNKFNHQQQKSITDSNDLEIIDNDQPHSHLQQQTHSNGTKVSGLDMKRINRYGTIPKNAQINAYFDSLRTDDLSDVSMMMSNEGMGNISVIERFNLDPTLSNEPDLLTVQHSVPSIPPIPSSSSSIISTSTFGKDITDQQQQRQRNVAILEDISNQTRTNNDIASTHHTNFTRQKSDLTHSKTNDNIPNQGGLLSSKVSVRTRGTNQKNHLHMLKSVAAPRLPKSTLTESYNNPMESDSVDGFPTPPAQFCNEQIITDNVNNSKQLAKSDSFDFVSTLTTTVNNNNSNNANQPSLPEPVEDFIPLNAIISSEDFPPPPPPTVAAFDSFEPDTSLISQANNEIGKNNIDNTTGKDKTKTKVKPTKDSKKSKKDSKDNLNKNVKTSVQIPVNQNSAFMSELYESFRLKAAKDATKGQESSSLTTEMVADSKSKVKSNVKESKQKNTGNSNSSRSSFLFKRTTSKPEPNCPAPAVPTLAANISQSKFYTKDLTESPSSSPAVDAEYVTPVLKKIPLKPIETVQSTPIVEPSETKPKSKPSKIAMFFNGGGPKSSNKTKQSESKESNTTSTVEQITSGKPIVEDEMLAKSIISNSGYDADDESKRNSAGHISNYKKFWESQTNSSVKTTIDNEADSGLGSCSSSNAATSKSNDSVISVGSIGSNNSSSVGGGRPTIGSSSSPKLMARGNSKIPTSALLMKNRQTNRSIDSTINSNSVDNIPNRCSNDDNQSETKQT